MTLNMIALGPAELRVVSVVFILC